MTANASQSVGTIIDKEFDVLQCYNFNAINEAAVGHLTALSFPKSGKTLKADIQVGNPESPSDHIEIAAVIEHIRWKGQKTDPIEITGRISSENKSILQEALTSKDGVSDVEAQWEIYDYDHTKKEYFKRFSSDGNPVKFVLTQSKPNDCEDTRCPAPQQPLNFRFQLTVTGKLEKGEDTSLVCAFNATNPFTRPIGVPVGA